MDYEEYMRNVLGYSQLPNNIYTNYYDDFYYDSNYQNNYYNFNNEMLESMYPEIYRIVYPMVCKICMQNNNREITKELVDRMTDEIYSYIESDERTTNTNVRPALKNGDVRNPNSKETELMSETRQNNFMLKDLIKILILRELLRQNKPGRPNPQPRPPRPQIRPPVNQRPTWRGY